MIEAPHAPYTDRRSSLYMYKVLQHLLLWLVVIRMQPQPDILRLTVKVAVVGDSLGFWLVHTVGYDYCNPHTSYSYQLLFIYMICVSAPATAASGYKDATPAWYLLYGTWEWMSLVSKLDSLLLLMIETPHTLHTHISSYSYIYEMPKTLTWGLAPLKCHVTSIIPKATLLHGLICDTTSFWT